MLAITPSNTLLRELSDLVFEKKSKCQMASSSAVQDSLGGTNTETERGVRQSTTSVEGLRRITRSRSAGKAGAWSESASIDTTRKVSQHVSTQPEANRRSRARVGIDMAPAIELQSALVRTHSRRPRESQRDAPTMFASISSQRSAIKFETAF